jgi:tetratricopeptide (TPR) repeat protein
MLELRHPETKPSNYTAIKTYFERALLLDPRHGPAYNAYGNMEFRRGNVTEAREVYKRGVQADCSDPASVYHGLAKIELMLGNIDVAREILIQGLQRVEAQDRTMDSSRHERAVFLVHTLGMLELNSKRIVEASKVFLDGLEKYERCSQLLLGAALCEVKLGSVEKSRRLFEAAVISDKKHAQAWQAWGVMESRAGNITTAKTLFEAGLKSSPRHGALWHAYGVMEGRMGHIDKARLLFSTGVRKCPNHVPLYQGWAGIEMKDGHLEEAKTLISDALTRDKTQGSSWLVAAQIEQLQGNDGLVGLLLRRGIECAPAEASLYRELGEYLANKGKINEAREILEKGLEVNPLHAPLYHSLAELEARIFNLEGLANLNKRAANIFNANPMVSSPSSSEAFSSKMRMEKSREVPGGVKALAEKVGYTDEEPPEEGNGQSLASPRQSMSDMEDEVVRDLFQDDTSL